MGREVFACRKCGHCCEGRGGIVLGRRDLARLCARLNLSEEAMIEKYCEKSRGKLVLGVGPDGYCVFFRAGEGCGVHGDKPDICRAWPFFRGNIEDEASFFMARQFCPGICRDTAHEEFASKGREYLRAGGLLGRDAEREANSLFLQ